MAIKWWQWRNIQEKLRLFGRAVQGVEPYRIEFEDWPHLTGQTDFEERLVLVNPEMIPGLKPRDAYEMTKAVLCHEAGHRRFTTPSKLPVAVHVVSNILEDQRIESLMMEEFAGTRPLIWNLTTALYDRSPDLEPSDEPGQVVAAALQHRWAVRLGEPLKGELSETNQRLWEEVRPLVEKAWAADSSRKVDRIACRIVKLLGIKDADLPDWVIQASDRCRGHRSERDESEDRAPGGSGKMQPPGRPKRKPQPFDGERVPDGHNAGSGRYSISPKPYAELEERAEPLARELIEELTVEPDATGPEPSERGGRLSVRQYLREHDRPFLLPDDDLMAPPALAVRVVIDHSTSMNDVSGKRTRMQSVAEAAMTLHLACTELRIDHAVSVTPQQETLADLESGERGKALIAGIVPAQTGFEDVAIAIDMNASGILASSAVIRLVLVLHDGYPNDGERAKKLCLSLRGKVDVIGVLLDPEDATRNAMTEIFGSDRLIACASPELPMKMVAMLRSIRGI
jgi:hypothetical protein